MFLSIVIPVYNSARYLPKCLASIWSQDLPESDYEVICVDDCSGDDSLDVLRQEATSHPNLRILQNATNLRAGGARNQGVKEAKGEYIQFIDSDDYFHPGSLLKAYAYQKEHLLDILVSDSSREKAGGKPSEQMVLCFRNQSVMTGRAFMLVNSLPFGPCKYFFKRSLMVDNAVWFEENVNCEDVDWTHKLAYYAQSVQYLPLLLFHYVLLPDSETGAEYKNLGTIRNRFFCASRVLNLRNLYSEEDEKSCLSAVAMSTYNVGARSMCASFSFPFRKYEIISSFFLNKKVEVKGFLLRFMRRCPKLFSCLSSILAPAARAYICIKRTIQGRL